MIVHAPNAFLSISVHSHLSKLPFTRDPYAYSHLEWLVDLQRRLYRSRRAPGHHEALSRSSMNRLYKGWNRAGGYGIVAWGRCSIVHITSNPSPFYSWLPSTSCWRIGLRLPVMEMVQVMCSSHLLLSPSHICMFLN